MASNTSVPREGWIEFLSLFTNGNRGRRVSIETISDTADLPIVSRAPLMALDYDPQGKGDDLVISLGQDSLTASHVVRGPLELWQAQDDNGKVVGMEVRSTDGTRTILTLE